LKGSDNNLVVEEVVAAVTAVDVEAEINNKPKGETK
jgi:hypothetical protein